MSDFFKTQNVVNSLYKISPRSIFIIICLSMPNIGFSAVVDGLFRSSVEVVSQQASDRDKAFNQALVKTLLKVSGNRDLVSRSDIQSSFFPAERYVQRFSYKENPEYASYLEKLDQLSIQEQENSQENNQSSAPLPYLLTVDFAQKPLEAQMKKINLPIWGNVRADVMFWVLVESDGERILLGNNEKSQLVEGLMAIAEDYALPISFPVADNTDLKRINISDLWGLFPDAIDSAKQRYSANGNLMVRLYQSSSDTWSANWHFSINNISYTGLMHNTSMLMINDEIFSFLTNILSKRFSAVSTELSVDRDMSFEVSNINNFKDYVDVQTFLEGLAPIKSFALNWVEGSVMSFSLELNGTSEQLQEYLNLSGRLKFISSNLVEIQKEPIAVEGKRELLFESEPEHEVTKSYVQIEKYKWVSTTPKTNK